MCTTCGSHDPSVQEATNVNFKTQFLPISIESTGLVHSLKMPTIRKRRPSPLKPPTKDLLAIGLEGSANKLGAGIIKHATDGTVSILSNVRHTYNPPPGEGFLPRDTAAHHRSWAMSVVKDAVEKAGLKMKDLDCICFTKGTNMRLRKYFEEYTVRSNESLIKLSCRPRDGSSITVGSTCSSNTFPHVQQTACWS